jgi:hypothetical protein
MDTRDRERLGEADERAFERMLLDSAAADRVAPEAMAHAWSQLARASVGVGVATGAAEVHGGRSGWLHSAAVKGWIVGAVCGSAITAAWLVGVAGMRPVTSVSPRSVPERTQPASTSSESAVPVPGPLIEAARSAAPAVVPAEQRHKRRRVAQLKPSASSPGPAPATSALEHAAAEPATAERAELGPALAAEVAALDAVRGAISGRMYLRALRLVDDYHQAFPAGQLAPDADALRIEAHAARGDRSAAERHAAAFLARYPNTPHAARIAALLAHDAR